MSTRKLPCRYSAFLYTLKDLTARRDDELFAVNEAIDVSNAAQTVHPTVKDYLIVG